MSPYRPKAAKAPLEQGSANRLEKIDQAGGPVGADRLNQRECGLIGPSLDVGAEGFAHLGERFVLLHEAASDKPSNASIPLLIGPLAGRRERNLRDDAGRSVQDQRLDRVSRRGDQRSDVGVPRHSRRIVIRCQSRSHGSSGSGVARLPAASGLPASPTPAII